jgi:LPS export ABC transporter protein LptC
MSQLHWSMLKWGSLALSIGSVVVAALLMWLHGGAEIAEQQPVNGKQEKATTQVDRPLIVERRGERLIWRLQADAAKQQQEMMLLTKPTLELFTESGEVIPIRGSKAWFEPLKRNIHFKGEVVAQYRQWILSCDELRYDSGTDEVVVPGAFQVKGPDVDMKGRKLMADRETQQIRVAHDVWVRDSRGEGLLK